MYLTGNPEWPDSLHSEGIQAVLPGGKSEEAPDCCFQIFEGLSCGNEQTFYVLLWKLKAVGESPKDFLSRGFEHFPCRSTEYPVSRRSKRPSP